MRFVLLSVLLLAIPALADQAPAKKAEPIKYCAVLDKEVGFGACQLAIRTDTLMTCLYVKGAGMSCAALPIPVPSPSPAPEAKK
jgi:hypothetical protein